MKLGKCSFALAAFLSFNASAAIEGIEYRAVTGEAVTMTPSQSQINYSRTSGSMDLFVSGGLDRRLRLIIKGEDGHIVADHSSTVITINDRLSFDGREFYGKTFSVSLPDDGKYSLEAQIISLHDQVVSSDQYALTKDTVPPSIQDDDITWVRAGNSYGSIDVFSNTSATRELHIKQVSDELSGLSHARYWTYTDALGKNEIDARLDPETGYTSVQAGEAAGSDAAPNSQDNYVIGFDIYDKAGNVSTIQRESSIDRDCPPNAKGQVWNPLVEQWEEYVSGLVIHENPVLMRWYRPKTEHTEFNDTNFGWAGNITNSDENYTYRESRFVYPQTRSYFELMSLGGKVCHSVRLNSLNFSLGDGVTEGPKGRYLRFQATYLADGTWSTHESPKHNEPYEITKVQFWAHPRPYRQKAWVNGYEPCFIEPEEETCEVPISITRSTGRGYTPIHWYLSREDESERLHVSYLYTYHDFNDPEVLSIDVDRASKAISVHSFDADRMNNWQINQWRIVSVAAKAIQDGREYVVPHSSTIERDYQNRLDRFDISGLPNGQFTIEVAATDSYGNIGYHQIENVLIDLTPPELSFRYEGGNLPATISNIRDMTLHVDNLSNAYVESILLTGSNAEEHVYLGYSKVGDSVYGLESPRIFPTLDEGEKYQITATVIDDFNNVGMEEIEFSYIPDNLVTIVTQPYLPTDRPLTDSLDNPLAHIYSESPLTIEGGQLATGPQDATVTNRIDSAVTINFIAGSETITLRPGDSANVIVDLGNTGELSVEIFPADADIQGISGFMFDVPNLRSKWD
ncbi:Ig-like domain-containing protein [Photobacterium sp. ZSDE20]|uniref:Ig-like domain-containing protein n=1 Tax=Photobacterium pectinilyticum TaxID=2906793 RepID=A0ABT1NBB2_9GAMM|nr:Ig-like domain-containing protein [Photobacterium sp. ZSDE20]MCQ1060609.1 Ig-like domain-containing protein [Photobacterium sp. ZSDE20]MDD1827804.1 Ig-like domain-containing protein [Photobacterium sp. ZSDE20]